MNTGPAQDPGATPGRGEPEAPGASQSPEVPDTPGAPPGTSSPQAPVAPPGSGVRQAPPALGAPRAPAALSATQAPGAPVEVVEVRPGSYHDSVTLLQVSTAVAEVPGVLAVQVAMGTELNLDLLAGLAFTVPPGAGPTDLVVALRGVDEAALEAARAALAAALAPRRPATGVGPGGGPAPAPRTIGAGARDGGATLALVSVPGQHAFTEALDALDAGLDVMVFSDNVPVAQEIRLKDTAAARGRLVMGPDCGTAVVSGVGLGFADVVRPGPVGVVAASGTGAQQLMSLLDGAGVGVRHCLGVGGRDLSAEVAGRSTWQALALLDADPMVELIVVVSKPPAGQVEADLRALAAGLSTPVRFALLGPGRPDLTEAAAVAVAALGRRWDPPGGRPAPRPRTGGYRWLRGAFAGGTLCDEAMLIAADILGPLPSNIPLPGAPRLGGGLRPPGSGGGDPGGGHAMVDFGEDELTRGRPHPMIDSTLRASWIEEVAAAPGGVVLLLDVVLGHGAHPDPSAELAPALARAHRAAAAAGNDLAVVVSLCGTAGDPQGLDRQADALAAAGASVHLSNADAARTAVALIGDRSEEGRR